MVNKKCPNCIKKENPKTKLYEFVCKKDGYRKCDVSVCPYENNDTHDDNSFLNYNFYNDF